MVSSVTRLVLVVVVSLLLGACGDDVSGESSEGQNDGQSDGHSDEHGAGHQGEGDGVSLEHIHGLGINPADGKLYAGSHHGVFLVTGTGAPEQIAERTQDFMGFTIIGPDHFLGSGHPGPDDTTQPPQLGLIESTDAARTWTSVSLSGEADFHAMEAKHDQVYGYDSVSGQIMVSKDRKNWDRRASLALADIAVSPDEPDELVATTQQGPARSTDGGRNFSPLEGAPALVFVDWPDAARLVGVAPDGTIHTSDDGGTSWTESGQVPGSPQAITTHADADVYVATEKGIHHSTDNGKTFTVLQEL